jgi:hypothetical protein
MAQYTIRLWNRRWQDGVWIEVRTGYNSNCDTNQLLLSNISVQLMVTRNPSPRQKGELAAGSCYQIQRPERYQPPAGFPLRQQWETKSSTSKAFTAPFWQPR